MKGIYLPELVMLGLSWHCQDLWLSAPQLEHLFNKHVTLFYTGGGSMVAHQTVNHSAVPGSNSASPQSPTCRDMSVPCWESQQDWHGGAAEEKNTKYQNYFKRRKNQNFKRLCYEIKKIILGSLMLNVYFCLTSVGFIICKIWWKSL